MNMQWCWTVGPETAHNGAKRDIPDELLQLPYLHLSILGGLVQLLLKILHLQQSIIILIIVIMTLYYPWGGNKLGMPVCQYKINVYKHYSTI